MRLAAFLTTMLVFLPSLSFAGPQVDHLLAKGLSSKQFNDQKTRYGNRCKAICSQHQSFTSPSMRTKCTGSRVYYLQKNAVCRTTFASQADQQKALFQQQWKKNRWSNFVVLDWSRMPGKKSGDYRRSTGIQGHSPEACIRGCLADKKCKAVEFSQKTCFYKKSTDATLVRYNGSHKVKNGQYQFTSRTIFKVGRSEMIRYNKLGRTAKNGVDRFGRDYKSIKGISWDGCRFACARQSQCKAITYRNKDRKCWLKNGIPNAKSAKGLKTAVIQ